MALLQPLIPRASQAMLGGIAPQNELGDSLGRTNELGDSLPALDSPAAPQTLDPLVARTNYLNADIDKRTNPVAPTTTLGKIGHVAANVGNVLGDIFAPDTMALIPHTQLYNERILARDKADLEKTSQLQTAETGRKQTEALTDYTQQRPEIEQGKIRQHLVTALAPKGFTVTDNPDSPGGFDIAEDPTSQGYKDRVSLSEMHNATAEKDAIQSEIAKNHYVPGTPEYAEAQRKLAQIDTRLNATLASLGLQRARLGLNEDKFYNPQPTAQERNKGDMGNSAIDQIHTMRTILSAHPEFAGPGAGATQAFQRWLSSNGEDAGKFLAARQYLADHSAAVFGGRGEYITKEMQGLTNPNFSISTLGGVLDQAEETAGRFTKAGQTHNKSGALQPQQSSTPLSSGGTIRAFDDKGVLHEAPAGTPLPKGWKLQ